MLYEYKIQKLLNGNNDIRYIVKYRSLKVPWICKKFKKLLNRWVTFDDYFKTIKDAQDKIEEELVKDKRTERAKLAKQNKFLEEYLYKMVPNHIPEEQIETYLTCKKKVL